MLSARVAIRTLFLELLRPILKMSSLYGDMLPEWHLKRGLPVSVAAFFHLGQFVRAWASPATEGDFK